MLKNKRISQQDIPIINSFRTMNMIFCIHIEHYVRGITKMSSLPLMQIRRGNNSLKLYEKASPEKQKQHESIWTCVLWVSVLIWGILLIPIFLYRNSGASHDIMIAFTLLGLFNMFLMNVKEQKTREINQWNEIEITHSLDESILASIMDNEPVQEIYDVSPMSVRKFLNSSSH